MFLKEWVGYSMNNVAYIVANEGHLLADQAK